VRVGMEATGYSRWFERLLAELGFEVWMGDPAEIKAKRVKKQKFDREDARLLLRLMRENNFPQIWVRVRRIGICDNFSGTGIGWCRCARES
jgi:transposase